MFLNENMDLELTEDFGIGDGGEVFVGSFGAEEVLGGVGIGADDDGDAKLFHFLYQPLAGVIVGMTAFIDAASVDFADEAEVVDEVDGLQREVAVPRLVFSKIAVTVMHHYLVWMADDGGAVLLKHGILVVEVGADTPLDVATK